MDPKSMASAIESLARQILDAGVDPQEPLVLVGIHTRGVPLAQRIASALLSLNQGQSTLVGTLDITQHRDDLGLMQKVPALLGSDIPFDIDGARVVLCDEVIHTGRSVRAALAEILDFGRPSRVQLAVLIDRGGREFPIQADYIALKVHIATDERVSVHFQETDGEDAVRIESTPSAALSTP